MTTRVCNCCAFCHAASAGVAGRASAQRSPLLLCHVEHAARKTCKRIHGGTHLDTCNAPAPQRASAARCVSCARCRHAHAANVRRRARCCAPGLASLQLPVRCCPSAARAARSSRGRRRATTRARSRVACPIRALRLRLRLRHVGPCAGGVMRPLPGLSGAGGDPRRALRAARITAVRRPSRGRALRGGRTAQRASFICLHVTRERESHAAAGGARCALHAPPRGWHALLTLSRRPLPRRARGCSARCALEPRGATLALAAHAGRWRHMLDDARRC